jgi:peptide/nickel transport system substrate-binding protein
VATFVGVFVAACLLFLPTVGTTAASAAPSGSLTVLELTGSTGSWTVLDPLTDTTSAEHWDFYNSIYGELFEQGPNGTIQDDLATGYKVTDGGLELDVTLRQGVTFSDGTPFNAAAVVFNWQRDFNKAAACVCAQNFASVSSVSQVGPYEVAMHLSSPDIALIDAFPEEAPNWIISPTAFNKAGATAFAQAPVGAGPFTVVSNVPSSKLALKANPNYWNKGEPKVENLTFTTVSSDLGAIQAIQAGQGDVYLGLTTPTVLKSAKGMSSLSVYSTPATASFTINLHPGLAPFNNILAREAIYYALDPQAINTHIEGGIETISETPTGPGGLFWTPKIPNYRTYDPAKAKAIVKQLGGISFTLWTITPSVDVAILEAEAAELAQVGIKATINLVNLETMVKASADGTVQAVATSVGNYNPSLLPGVPFAYSSTSPFSNVKDPALDKLINAAVAAPTLKVQGQDYQKVFSYLNTEAYAPYLFTYNHFDVAKKDVTGINPQLPEVDWETVSS